ncbi:helix-turn-helix domain-containing protein [Brevibacillus fulvus]|uniref:Uncharacterized protein YpbB n=1 Tax=Brevibacillus fulvus TaxID=1125967 RepID=A0A938XVE0_9BACL|nr:helix-turn-helix domain-containing protein [Brevibacillus fulvus]MBM7588671.1 uncharacterized protein YpbB [Brevibacillus fulvus]
MSNPILHEREFMKTLLLNGLLPLEKQRTVQSLYYILRGRKGNQTVQDVYLFRLHPYYRLFPKFSREYWEEIIASLKAQRLLQLEADDRAKTKPTFLLTAAGKQFLREGVEQYQLDNWLEPIRRVAANEQLQSQWLKLHLLVQTVSQLLHRDIAFYPVVQQRSIQQWVKEQLGVPSERERWMNELVGELELLLQAFPERLQQLVVRQFSGAGQTGSTLPQLARQWQEPPSFLWVKLLHCLAVMAERIQAEQGENFPLLHRLFTADQRTSRQLSDSAAHTWRLLRQNLSIAEIARQRRLSPNTVEDHLVEIALLYPDWDISPYISDREQREIQTLSSRLQTRRLRLLKNHLQDKYSYLQIRLALARQKGAVYDD